MASFSGGLAYPIIPPLRGSETATLAVPGVEGNADVIVAGEGDHPPFEDLLSALNERAGDITINLKVVPEHTFEGRTGE
jgi:hypothetical protein